MRPGLALSAFLFLTAPAGAQQVYKGYGNSNSTFLLGNNMARHTQCLYLPSDLIGPQAGLITRLYYRYGNTGQAAGVTLGNIVIALRLTDQTAFANGNVYFTGLQPVLQAETLVIPPGTTGDWFPIDLDTPFSYAPDRTLVIDIVWETSTTQNFGTYGTANNGRKLYSASGGTTTGTTTSTTWQDMGFDLDIGTGVHHVRTTTPAVFPNPFTDALTVALPAAVPGAAMLRVSDASGRVVHEASVQGDGPWHLDLGALPAGVFIVTVEGARGRFLRERIVKE